MDGAGADRSRRRRRVDDGGSLERRSCNLPTDSATHGPQGWADLPNELLYSIALLVSFPDLLAIGATCPSWREALSLYPSESGSSSLLPPLLLQPDVPLCSPRPRPCSNNLVPRRPCHVTNLANQNIYMCCQIPLFCNGKRNRLRGPLDKFRFAGASYGHLILSNEQSSLVVLVDVFTGVQIKPPKLLVRTYTHLYYATLTGPVASPNSHLIVTTGSEIFFWHVGSRSTSWVGHSTCGRLINELVFFKGQVFGMGNDCRLYIVHLLPNIRIQQIAVDWGQSITSHCRMLLVACGDMLLMVTYPYPKYYPLGGNKFEAFRLDLSNTPAKWVKVEKLENWAIFISVDTKSQQLCCMNPEKWGGKSNCVYCYDSKEWIACELGKPLQGGASMPIFDYCSMMQPMWAVPSMFYPRR